MISVEQLRKLIEEKKIIIGQDRTLTSLRSGKLKEVLLAKNAAAATRGQVERLAQTSGVKIEVLSVPNDELGTMCKKPFAISVLGIKR